MIRTKKKPWPAKEENGQGKCKEVGLLGQGNPMDSRVGILETRYSIVTL